MAKTVLDMPGIQAPIGYFDPVGYSTKVSDEGMLWFRAAELKHSRVAMLAFTGWCINGAGIHFPGYLSKVDTQTTAPHLTAPHHQSVLRFYLGFDFRTGLRFPFSLWLAKIRMVRVWSQLQRCVRVVGGLD